MPMTNVELHYVFKRLTALNITIKYHNEHGTRVYNGPELRPKMDLNGLYELGMSNNRDSERDGVTFPRGGSQSPIHI